MVRDLLTNQRRLYLVFLAYLWYTRRVNMASDLLVISKRLYLVFLATLWYTRRVNMISDLLANQRKTLLSLSCVFMVCTIGEYE